MKNFQFHLILISIGSILLFSTCELTNEDPCEFVSCLNGGSCNNGNCLCPTGYIGENCQNALLPSAFRVEALYLTDFPDTDGPSCWDASGGCYPELYLVIKQGTTTLFTSTYYPEAMSPGNYSYQPNSPINFDYSTLYTIQFYDYDGSIVNSELVTGGYLRLSSIYSPPLPSNTLNLSNTSRSYQLSGEWLF